ncbi:MAG: hypothetical protein JOZ41_13595 [Chloroflexi bacterium]|nr:hypothetical protein [Chloroflexota bacterium]
MQTQVLSPAGPTFSAGAQRAPAHLTAALAQGIASHEFGSWILLHSITASYGSFTDNAYVRATPAGRAPVGTIDAWEVTVTGLNVPRPCPPGVTCPPIQTMTVSVDDKAGQYVEAVGQ